MKKSLILAALCIAATSSKAYNVIANITQTQADTWEFSLNLQQNQQDFTAFQLDITLEGDVQLPEDGLQCAALMSNHQLSLGTPGGHYRLVGYSLQNTSFTATEGALAKFTITGQPGAITIDSVLFAKADGTTYPAADFTCLIDPDHADPDAIRQAPGQTPAQPYSIYDLSGRSVNIGKNGIYIVGGKKMLIK